MTASTNESSNILLTLMSLPNFIIAISSSSKYTTFFVYSINGEASEATKNSVLFFPTPIAIGLPNLD